MVSQNAFLMSFSRKPWELIPSFRITCTRSPTSQLQVCYQFIMLFCMYNLCVLECRIHTIIQRAEHKQLRAIINYINTEKSPVLERKLLQRPIHPKW